LHRSKSHRHPNDNGDPEDPTCLFVHDCPDDAEGKSTHQSAIEYMARFTRLAKLDLSSNAITSVAAGELALPENVIRIDLRNNSITTVAPGAFPVQ